MIWWNSEMGKLHPHMLTTLFFHFGCTIECMKTRQIISLRGTWVHQKYQRKQQAIKMTVCVIAALYICILPSGLCHDLEGRQTAISCSVSKVLWFISFIMLYLSSSMNWIQICMTFVQSFPQGFKETLMFWRKCLTPRSNMERSQSEEITLQDMRIIPGTGENISFNENWPWRGRLNICKKIIAISWTQFQKKSLIYHRQGLKSQKIRFFVSFTQN